MHLPLRRALSAAASASAPVRRALSAAATAPVRRALSTATAADADADASRHPGWVMIRGIRHATAVRTPSPRASLLLAEPPCSSYLLLPDHLVDQRPVPQPGTGIDMLGLLNAVIYATSGDGLLLFAYVDSHFPLSIVSKAFAGAMPTREGELDLDGLDPQDQHLTRFVCNPITGELFCLPDIDGTKKTFFWRHTGLLTRSAAGHGPPDSYAVAMLREHSNSGTFHMWRFLSRTGKWEKLEGLPSPLPLLRRLDIDTEAVAFAGRLLWWVDLTWGVISADPFSDRPELHFVELPRGSVWPMPSKDLLVEVQSIHRRVGVSEGKLRYVEVSDKDPFMLSSFALDDDGSSWTLVHRVALDRICEVNGGGPKDTPRIGVIDPLNSSIVCVIVGKHVLAVDMAMGKVLGSSPVQESECSPWFITSVLKSCVLPPWLASSKIPAAVEGTSSSNKDDAKSKTLSDILVRVDRGKEN